MSVIGRRFRGWAIGVALLALATLAPAASAQDEPAFVFPCVDGLEFEAQVDQSILFLCGWGTQGGPGLIRTFLNAHSATLVVKDEQGDPVLAISPSEFATLWGEPESSPSGFDDVTCAGPTTQGVFWSYLLDGGLPEGSYTVALEERLRHPVTDGFHTCWLPDGTPLVEPPSWRSGNTESVGTLFVGD